VIVVGVVVLLVILIYNSSKRDTCAEQGKGHTGGIIVKCEERNPFR
jgi:hypothetical protein